MFSNVQPAVKKETGNVAIYTVTGTIIVLIVYFVFSKVDPEHATFDYTVIIGALGGVIIAVLNFFLMGMTVQKVAATEDEDRAKKIMKSSYSRRFLLQIGWVIIALAVPAINWITGIIPLFFPSFGIKIKGIISNKKYSKNGTGGET